MKIQPIAGPMPVQPTVDRPASADVKAKVVAMLTGQNQQPQENTTVQNATQVSAEEMGAVKPKTSGNDVIEAQSQEVTETEPKAEEKPKVDPAITAQYAKIARQEQALRAKAQAQEAKLKAREEALAAREAQLTATPSQPTQGYTKDEIKARALDILAESGVSYEELTQQIINQQPRDPRVSAEMEMLKAEIKALREENQKTVKTIEEREQQTYRTAISQLTNEATTLVNSDPEFETIKATGSVKDVVDLIEQTLREEGRVMTVEEACRETEDYLLEQLTGYASKIQKIQKRLQAGQPKPQVEQPKPVAEQKQVQQPTMKTLTNATSSSRPLSARERAILAMEGRLKS
jgi:hypothetical protein